MNITKCVDQLVHTVFQWVPIPEERTPRLMYEALLQEFVGKSEKLIEEALVLDAEELVRQYWTVLHGSGHWMSLTDDHRRLEVERMTWAIRLALGGQKERGGK